jgi:hypothetical protein
MAGPLDIAGGIAREALPVVLAFAKEIADAARAKNDAEAIAALDRFVRDGAPALTASLDVARRARAEADAMVDAAEADEVRSVVDGVTARLPK